MEFAKFDKRIIDRNLKNGTVTPKEYQDYLKGLEDLSEDAGVVHIPLYPWEADVAEQAEAEEGDGKRRRGGA